MDSWLSQRGITKLELLHLKLKSLVVLEIISHLGVSNACACEWLINNKFR
jgi:hypothetical protein